ncbi:MAG: PAS domain-containing protein [Rhizomicrobium sp.]
MASALQHAPINEIGLVNDFARVPEPRHPSARRLLDYWQAVMARGDGFLVGRDVPAREIAPLLCNIMVNQPLADGTDIRVRLAGTSVRRRFATIGKDTRLSALFPAEDFRHHLAAGHEVVATGRPIIVDSSLKRASVEELHMEVIILPILDRDRATPLLLVGVFYFG